MLKIWMVLNWVKLCGKNAFTKYSYKSSTKYTIMATKRNV